MAYNFQRNIFGESWKVLWVVSLILASILVFQYFELPYRGSLASLLSFGNPYFSERDLVTGENQGFLRNKSFPEIPKLRDGWNSTYAIRSPGTGPSSEVEMRNRSISIAPVTAESISDISPSIVSSEEVNAESSSGNRTIAVSPLKSVAHRENAAPAPAPTVSPILVLPSDNDIQFNRTNDIPPTASSSEEAANAINSKTPESNLTPPGDDLSATKSAPAETPEIAVESVLSIDQMSNMLLHSRVSSFSKRPLWPSAADHDLLEARLQIEHAPIVTKHPNLYAPIYRNISRFARSYELMERMLKVYIYKDGKAPVFHRPNLKGIYASEGWFMKHIKESNRFLTSNPDEAHLFYFPFSSQLLGQYVYVKNSHSFDPIIRYMTNYLDTIKGSYRFWNRTDGSDHFLVACHDWGPVETRTLMPNCIRALCNSDVKEGFKFGKDVSLPETSIHNQQNPMKEAGGAPASQRKILAFFAGQMHGYVRPILLKHWENKDPEMKIVGRMRKGYSWHMKNSKYCICAKGYEVNSPRVVEAIMFGCVPVIISDNFVPPFFEILKWESFAVFVLEKDIPNLKSILTSISERRYHVMQSRVKQVRQHFRFHKTPVKYDIFHMILHSIWYNRVFRMMPGSL